MDYTIVAYVHRLNKWRVLKYYLRNTDAATAQKEAREIFEREKAEAVEVLEWRVDDSDYKVFSIEGE